MRPLTGVGHLDIVANYSMLKGNMSYAPFMGAYKSISVGLNPLGIRTASEQLFTTLLPGLNVVTSRIRYYSFYCWLLKTFYANRAEAKKIDFQRHIRKSELLMALIHAQSSNSLGVPGITRAFEIIEKGEEVINFNEDAMPGGKPEGGYWKASFGAFGTYYVASLRDMGIILPLIDNTNLYNVTPQSEDSICGDELADAFAESVGFEMGKLFEKCASSGIVTREELKELEPFFQSHHLTESKEKTLLLKMLLQNGRHYKSEDSKLRKDSLRLLLNYLNKPISDGFSELSFAKYVYDKYHEGVENSLAAVGWYAYYLNDSRQYEALIIFDALLHRLNESTKPGQWESIDELTSELAEGVCRNLNAEDLTMNELLANWESIDEPTEKMAKAFYVLLDNYWRNPNYKDCKSAIRTYFRNVSNDALDAFDTIERSMNNTVYDYVKHFLTEDIIYNHYSESMRKYSQNRIPTQKLTIENGFVRGIGTYSATHSSPRIETLRNFATDLGLISNNIPTPEGEELLKKLKYD